MNQSPDPLEAELAELRPPAPSAGLKQRIAEQLAAEPAASPRRLRNGLLLAALAASALAAAVVLWPRGDGPVVGAKLPDAPPHPRLTDTFNQALPSVWSFRRALTGSPSELDELLDRHAGLTGEAGAELAQFHVHARRSDAQLRTLLGEL